MPQTITTQWNVAVAKWNEVELCVRGDIISITFLNLYYNKISITFLNSIYYNFNYRKVINFLLYMFYVL